MNDNNYQFVILTHEIFMQNNIKFKLVFIVDKFRNVYIWPQWIQAFLKYFAGNKFSVEIKFYTLKIFGLKMIILVYTMMLSGHISVCTLTLSHTRTHTQRHTVDKPLMNN